MVFGKNMNNRIFLFLLEFLKLTVTFNLKWRKNFPRTTISIIGKNFFKNESGEQA